MVIELWFRNSSSSSGMVAGMLIHKIFKENADDKGWIKTLLDEAENERMHL